MLFLYFSYFGHRCIELNLIFISLLTAQCATLKLKDFRNASVWTF